MKSPEKECQDDTLEEWQQIYSKLAGNEIHSITAENSKFFQEFIGKTFVQASCQAHKKYKKRAITNNSKCIYE
jgi:mevalonate pyrophosphate decarboxylase